MRAYVFALAAMVALAGCHREQKRVIAVIPKGNVTQYWQSVHAGANKAARELNVDIAPDGSVYGIELLNANEQLRAADGGQLVLVNEADGREVTVPLADSARPRR